MSLAVDSDGNGGTATTPQSLMGDASDPTLDIPPPLQGDDIPPPPPPVVAPAAVKFVLLVPTNNTAPSLWSSSIEKGTPWNLNILRRDHVAVAISALCVALAVLSAMLVLSEGSRYWFAAACFLIVTAINLAAALTKNHVMHAASLGLTIYLLSPEYKRYDLVFGLELGFFTCALSMLAVTELLDTKISQVSCSVYSIIGVVSFLIVLIAGTATIGDSEDGSAGFVVPAIATAVVMIAALLLPHVTGIVAVSIVLGTCFLFRLIQAIPGVDVDRLQLYDIPTLPTEGAVLTSTFLGVMLLCLVIREVMAALSLSNSHASRIRAGFTSKGIITRLLSLLCVVLAAVGAGISEDLGLVTVTPLLITLINFGGLVLMLPNVLVFLSLGIVMFAVNWIVHIMMHDELIPPLLMLIAMVGSFVCLDQKDRQSFSRQQISHRDMAFVGGGVFVILISFIVMIATAKFPYDGASFLPLPLFVCAMTLNVLMFNSENLRAVTMLMLASCEFTALYPATPHFSNEEGTSTLVFSQLLVVVGGVLMSVGVVLLSRKPDETALDIESPNSASLGLAGWPSSIFPEFTAASPVQLSNLSLAVSFADGSSRVFSDFQLSLDVISFDGPSPALPTIAMLTGNVTNTSVPLTYGASPKLPSSVTAIVPHNPAGLQDGDFALSYA